MAIEAIKKTQTEGIEEMENLRKRTGITNVSMTNRVEEMEERISGIGDMIEEIDALVKKMLNQKSS